MNETGQNGLQSAEPHGSTASQALRLCLWNPLPVLRAASPEVSPLQLTAKDAAESDELAKLTLTNFKRKVRNCRLGTEESRKV
jgi:hypothetical protein